MRMISKMSGIIGINELIRSLGPRMQEEDFAFCTVPGSIVEYAALDSFAFVREEEGLTLILPVSVAEREMFRFEGTFRKITFTVHSSLEAVGLTAMISSKLAANGIPANVVAGHYHDHVFVPSGKAKEALALLQTLGGPN